MCVRSVLDSLGGRLEVVRASEMTDLDARSAVRMVPRVFPRVAFGGFDRSLTIWRLGKPQNLPGQVLTILTSSGPEPTYFDHRGRPITHETHDYNLYMRREDRREHCHTPVTLRSPTPHHAACGIRGGATVQAGASPHQSSTTGSFVDVPAAPALARPTGTAAWGADLGASRSPRTQLAARPALRFWLCSRLTTTSVDEAA